MSGTLSPSAQRVQDALRAAGSRAVVREYASACRTAQEAAAVLGCDLAQIAKSIVFRGEASGRPILVITSGAHRVDRDKVARLVGERPGKADADYVREHTGFVIGGVAPIALARPATVLFDETLLRFSTIFPAGGTPQAMFEIASEELVRVSGATVADVIELAP
ncbi:MAG: YbaK/EbsC family protein [Casimicrobiaceae bacterium]|nr:YbaK/EbsC family protein [Casimicrobiaceae bacterium]MDW8311944.1 YbaK/EbsC family protein [Burkholderiales bacterium]